MDDRPADRRSSDLCTQCGFCCSGVLFDWVPVPAEDVARLRSIGLPIEQQPEGPRFPQPCIKFERGLCQIYPDRPRSCRHFRCELLKSLEGGRVTFDEAGDIVAEAKAMIERLRPVIEREFGSLLVGRSWTSIFKRWESASPTKRAERSKARIVLELTSIEPLPRPPFQGRVLEPNYGAIGKRRLSRCVRWRTVRPPTRQPGAIAASG